jgi:hypothetical protein
LSELLDPIHAVERSEAPSALVEHSHVSAEVNLPAEILEALAAERDAGLLGLLRVGLDVIALLGELLHQPFQTFLHRRLLKWPSEST